MPAPRPLLAALLGHRTGGAAPNVADKLSKQSSQIATSLLGNLNLLGNIVPHGGQTLGREFEFEVANDLRSRLKQANNRVWDVQHPGRPLAEFEQYQHLGVLDQIIDDDDTGVLALAIGRDYEVKPDVTVGEKVPQHALPLLHATVSCKATIRSDRAQNVRLEAFMLNRHRNGRLPHIVVVTAEPLPSRLASLCRGTGDIDAVYHLALPELRAAVAAVGNEEQQSMLDELVAQRRLLDYSDLISTLAR